MAEDKTWLEALDIAKDQMRHGKIHYADLQKATQEIYKDLLELQSGPIFEIEQIQSKAAQIALPDQPVSKYKHEIIDGKVRCADCGKKYKSLSINHLRSHGYSTREEYMNKYSVSEENMQGTIDRSKLKRGEENPLTVQNAIMKKFNIKRGQVTASLKEVGIDRLKTLIDEAKKKNMSPVDLLEKIGNEIEEKKKQKKQK